MPGDFPVREWFEFNNTLWERLETISSEQIIPADRDNLHHFVMPCGLFLVIDEDNGGDITAQELVKRFHFLDQESRNIIDFYFLGWKRGWEPWEMDGIRFDLASFNSCRNALRDAGIKHFGGNADLILVDAHYRFKQLTDRGGITDRSIMLDFRSAIQVDLSGRSAAGDIPPLGEFLQSIISAAEEVRDAILAAPERGAVALISNHLGLAVAKKSLLQFIYAKWGSIIGAHRLDVLAVRNLGPQLPINKLRLKGISVR